MTNIQKSIPHFESPAVTQLEIAQTGIYPGRRNQSDLGPRRSFTQGIQCISLGSLLGSIVFSRRRNCYRIQWHAVHRRLHGRTSASGMCRKIHFQRTTGN